MLNQVCIDFDFRVFNFQWLCVFERNLHVFYVLCTLKLKLYSVLTTCVQMQKSFFLLYAVCHLNCVMGFSHIVLEDLETLKDMK